MPGKIPDFSVIIPTKDRPAMLVRAMRSVLAQRHADFEIIVADDGAGEGAAVSRSLVESVALTAFVTGGLGQVPARNMAMAHAKGRWIAYLDDDDWWELPEHLAVLARALADGVGLAHASGRIVREGPGASSDDWIPFDSQADAEALRFDNKLLISGIGYDRLLHQRLGPLDESLPVYWDWDWYLRLAEAGIRFVKTGTDGVRISTRLDNVSSQANEAKRRAELSRLAAKHGLTGLILKNHEIIAIEQSQSASSGG